MILKKEKKHNVTIYVVSKNKTEEEMETLKNSFIEPSMIELILQDNTDVYTDDGKLLLRFRKHVLSNTHLHQFYTNVIQFAKLPTSNRGSASGSDLKTVANNPKIRTNIIGYFDKFSPKQKELIRKSQPQSHSFDITVRETRFVVDYPDRYEQLLPLIEEIDALYAHYIPTQYQKQKQKADQTPFKIGHTSFTTITTNVNFQTSIHKDEGDYADGFGNLVVIKQGDYEGGETCFPQYGIGANVQTGDILFMDVHQWHGNLPIVLKTEESIRLSIVCYLRYGIWMQTHHKTKKFMMLHNRKIRSLKKQR